MTDRERLYTAKLYMDKLANGMNPLDGEELPEDTLLNDVYLCRTFMFVSGILDEVIRNNCMVTKMPNSKKEKFRITESQRVQIKVTEEAVGVSAIVSRISRVLDKNVRNVTSLKITGWLEAQGLLRRVTIGGRTQKVATDEGNVLGIETRTVTYGDKEYRKTLYNMNAQGFIIANLEDISEFIH